MNTTDHPLLIEAFSRSLRSPLVVTNVNQRRFLPGLGIGSTIVTTCRLILVLSGEMVYTVEGKQYKVEAGCQLLVPSWCRRGWIVSGLSHCELTWCEFDDDSKEMGLDHCFCRQLTARELNKEKKAYRAIHRLWQDRQMQNHAVEKMYTLKLEGQLKSLLVRFWPAARLTWATTEKPRKPLHPQVRWASRWIEQHYAEPEVLACLYEKSSLTCNYLRQLFRTTMHCSPGEYVKQVRMRRARYLLHTTDLQQKQIAFAVGYTDALYFSRMYRQFWGHSPTEETRS